MCRADLLALQEEVETSSRDPTACVLHAEAEADKENAQVNVTVATEVCV